MGPLVPDIIGNELNFIVAFFIGIAFGFILEQAGFSTSKKLVGLFYGYDFTVLRVFFTAGVVAMIGVVALNHFGLLDINLVYVNPTFLWSAIVGGLIMGLGFVVGGYCPGTSVCAMAIGKIDALIFVLGSFIGVFLFAEGYPLFEKLYKAEAWGNIQMFNLMGISQSLFAFLLTTMAVVAFVATTWVETRVNGGKLNSDFRSKPLYYSLTIIAILIGLSAFMMPDRKENLLSNLDNKEFVETYNIPAMDIDEFAFNIYIENPKLQIIDFRLQKEFDSLRFPQSYRYDLVNLFDKDPGNYLSLQGKITLFIAQDPIHAKKGAILASQLGYKNVTYLNGGIEAFRNYYLNIPLINKDSIMNLSDVNRFREEAGPKIVQILKDFKSKNSGTEQKKSKRVVGGC